MKKTLLLIIILFQFLLGFSQSKTDDFIFENNLNWKQEIIEFPIDWAPKVELQGVEEILFAPEWSSPRNDHFWSLIIGWKIDRASLLTLAEIQDNLFGYFDGLMKPNHWAKEFPEPKIHLTKRGDHFQGHMTFFDGFHTGKVITVNIQGDQRLYQIERKSVITFRISPKEQSHSVWNQLKQINPIKEKVKSLIDLDESWGKEVFPFPIPFAQDIQYGGIAEVRFPPKGWRDPKHPFFWSYTYVWDIEGKQEMDSKELSDNLVKYFDGLNGAKDEITKTYASIIKIGQEDSITFFAGDVDIYDRFATHERITLNVLIESSYCPKRKRTRILFKFSPKELSHKTWKTLKTIRLADELCE